jgi:hypothetical protein
MLTINWQPGSEALELAYLAALEEGLLRGATTPVATADPIVLLLARILVAEGELKPSDVVIIHDGVRHAVCSDGTIPTLPYSFDPTAHLLGRYLRAQHRFC